MKQIIQNYRTGELELADVPVPVCSSNNILVKNEASLISIGTERSIIDLAKKSLLGKAKARPDLVKRFIDKAKKEGLIKTFQEALGRLDNPVPLGYSSAGVVVEVGKNVNKFSPGDRVACIGAGYASHSEYIKVPENLCCLISESVSFEEASFGMIGIIALHGVRCAKITFGETVAVIGLGLIGLLTVQILKSYGSRVIGFDIEPGKIELAKSIGIDYAFTDIEEFKNTANKFTNGFGVDAVLITAATKSDEPVNIAVEISRYGGKVVIVGVADIHPDRNEMWHKEVEIIVSKAAGPGSLDPLYENKGIDYPIGYIRWTENRNLEEFIRLVSVGKIKLNSFITHKFNIKEAENVYKNILENKGGPYIGVILNYPNEVLPDERRKDRLKSLNANVNAVKQGSVVIGVIGAGLFGKALLLPTLSKIKDVKFHTLSTSSSANAYHTGKKYGFENCATDYTEVLNNREINSVVILTPHSLHAKMVMESLRQNKHVFVEKPLSVNEVELKEIADLISSEFIDGNAPYAMVGYNRRFSPHSVWSLDFLKNRKDPVIMNYRINAGFVPKEHWVHSEEEGGSRVVGEICHFVDMFQFLTGSEPYKIYAERVSGNNSSIVNSDNATIMIKFKDGSVGNIIYTGSGDKAFSREYIEIFCEGKTITLKDFKETDLFFNGKRKVFKTINQDMGYKNELEHFVKFVKGDEVKKITFNEIYYSTLAVFKINESLETGKPILL